MSQTRATLATVAQAAGVSLATASKAINGHDDVAENTRARVEKAIAETGYTTPKSRRKATEKPVIEFLVDKLASPFAMEVLRGVTLAVEEVDIDVVVGRFHPTNVKNDADIIKRLERSGRLGAIIVTAHLSDEMHQAIKRSPIPIVFIDPLRINDSSVVSVGSTNWIGGRSATEHLIGLGHTKLAILGGPRESISATARIDGFRSAASAAGIDIRPEFVRHCLFDFDAACSIALEILSDPQRPTGIFATSESQAMGVLEAARQKGLLVPQDLSVVGYDDTAISRWAHPPLTTVYQPLQDIGRVCIRTIQQLHNGEQLDSHHIELATRLTVRESTAPPSDRT